MQQTESESDASTFNVLVANLGMPTPIAWPGRAAFLEMLSQRLLSTDTIVVYDAPIDQLRDLMELAEGRRIPRFNLLFHDSYTGEAVIRVPSRANSAAVFRIVVRLGAVLDDLGFDDFINWHGSATITSPDGRYTAEPDTCFLPTSPYANPGTRFPSVMVEVGMTQSRPSLRRVMRGWFEMSGGLVKIIILVDIRCRLSGRHEIVFEKWRYPGGRPVCDTEVSVALRPDFQDPGAPYNYMPADFTATTTPESAPLPMTLEFDLVCDRAPGPGEGDILLPALFFQDVACRVWRSFCAPSM